MNSTQAFFNLKTDSVVELVEKSLREEKSGARATGRILALNSLENRVFEIEFEDSSFVVAKFYRPGRWSEEQITEEHEFLDLLEEAEVPVVSPLDLNEDKSFSLNSMGTLGRTQDGIFFAVYPKVRGRLSDELSSVQLETLGRYLGRLHQIGRTWTPEHRWRIHSENYLKEPIEFLLRSSFLDAHMKPHYQQIAERVLKIASEKLEGQEIIAVHGDCHLGNVLWNGDEAFLMDFDDMMMAPAVQDLWMVIRGRDEQAMKDRQAFLKGYEQMTDFSRGELSLIEALRAIRIIYYSAWIARRWEDPSFPQAFPQFATQSYWRSEIEALMECLQILESGSLAWA